MVICVGSAIGKNHHDVLGIGAIIHVCEDLTTDRAQGSGDVGTLVLKRYRVYEVVDLVMVSLLSQPLVYYSFRTVREQGDLVEFWAQRYAVANAF